MKDEHIEPGAGLLFWLIHLDPALPEQPVQSLVLDGAHAIDGHPSYTLGQEQRRHFDLLEVGVLAKVVDQAGSMQLV